MTISPVKCVAIGGVPATGKSTLVKQILKNYSYNRFKFGLLRGHFIQKLNIVVMGIYDNDIFCGTDKLSMAVNKDFIKYVLLKKRNILFEGDRLFSLNNLELIEKHYKTKVIILENDSILLKERHEERNDAQSEKFIKGRYTKIKNIKDNLKNIELHSLKNLNDTSFLVDKIIKFL
tara:strand:+ start:41 stop:568 length:528 start_codon:yes stop_codon:yes gene_type:complete